MVFDGINVIPQPQRHSLQRIRWIHHPGRMRREEDIDGEWNNGDGNAAWQHGLHRDVLHGNVRVSHPV